MTDTIASIHRRFIVGGSNKKSRTGKNTVERFYWTVPGLVTSQLFNTLDACVQDLTDYFIDKEMI